MTGVNGAGRSASYAYDPLGNLISQTVNGATTNYQVDPDGDVVAAFSGNRRLQQQRSLIAHYTYGFGLVSQVSAAGAAGYYDFNIAGSTIGITNSSGKYVNQYTYLPFGQTTTLAAGVSNPFTFVGGSGVLNNGSGLLLMGSRHSRPLHGPVYFDRSSGVERRRYQPAELCE